MKTWIALALLTLSITISASAGVIDNDATCDIKVGPAATLLLPYFEIDLENAAGQTTLFTGGWMYLNLNNGGSTSYSVTAETSGLPRTTNLPGALAPAGATTTSGPRPSQNWVTITMFGNLGPNSLAGEFDAASLGNGCSPAAFAALGNTAGVPIGPAGGVFVCPPGQTLTNGTTTLCTGTNLNPKP